jgi:hypothetical protein
LWGARDPESNYQGFCEAPMSSSSVQQAQWPCVTEHQSCQSSHVNGAIHGSSVGVISLPSLGCYFAPPSLNLAEILCRSFVLVG